MGSPSHRDWFERDPTYAHVPRQLREAGLGATLVRVEHQPAGVYSRPAAPEFGLNVFREGARSTGSYGSHWLPRLFGEGSSLVVPADCDVTVDNPDPHRADVLILPRAGLRTMFPEEERLARSDPFGHCHEHVFRDPLIAVLVDRLWAEAQAGAASALFRDHLVATITAGLLHLGSSGAPVPSSPGMRRLDADQPRAIHWTDWRLRRAIEVLESQLTDDIGLVELAALVDLTPQRLTALFRAGLGEPPHRYRTRRRVERACEMLADHRRSITDVAHACGFASSQHFATVFKRHLNVTPTEYRRERLR